MIRLRRICVAALAAGVVGGLFTSGASALGRRARDAGSTARSARAAQVPQPGPSVDAPPAAAAIQPRYVLYVDFVRLGRLAINPTTHECAVEGLIELKGECSAESTFSASLLVPSGFLEVGLQVEGIPHRNERVAYAGWGRLLLEFAGKPRVWVEVRKAL